ncbi:wd-repeat protein interacting with phosphoinosides wipi -related [Anaeramoeba flamelloides]|uniref:Wd-repeat protein interacting with phosphoinosides wipi -related n=1 Tax=Anaeramoeba flamelloides TaxID=1746091 RepID=A0AAV8ACZ2_9EUKA|nr:wd-repeat protein interacting with phosphoinosides wipi -related [Anaeramoeba flamelloides]
MNELSTQEDNKLQYLNFNSKKNQFICSTTDSFKIYTACPFLERFESSFNLKKLKFVEILGSSNVLCYVSEKYPKSVFVWDDIEKKELMEVQQKTNVCSIRINLNTLIVLTETSIIMYQLSDLSIVNYYSTMKNPKGIISVKENLQDELEMIAIFDDKIGFVRVVNYTEKNPFNRSFQAFEEPLGGLKFNNSGRYLAVSTSNGKRIRIFESKSGICLLQLIVGNKDADIYSMSFSRDHNFFVITSSNGSLQLFELPFDLKDSSNRTKERNGISFGKHGQKLQKCIINYKLQNSSTNKISFVFDELILVATNGWYYRFLVNPEKKTIKEQEENHFYY